MYCKAADWQLQDKPWKCHVPPRTPWALTEWSNGMRYLCFSTPSTVQPSFARWKPLNLDTHNNLKCLVHTEWIYCTGKSAQALWNKWKTFSPCQDQDVQPLQAAFTRLQRSSFDPLLHYFQFCPQVGSGRATFFHSDWGLNPEIIIAMNQQKDINSTVTGSHSHSHTYSIKAHTRPKLPMNINALHTHSAKT